MASKIPNIAIIGSALYGNQGAAAMLLTSIQEVSKRYPRASFSLLSLYPETDSQKNRLPNLSIYNAKPLYLALVIIPLSVIWRLLPFLRSTIGKNRSVRAFTSADVILDQGGITFVDGRGAFLVYNVASLLPGVILSKKTIKISQALGPFKKPANRMAAKFFLPRMYHILARGAQTAEHLKYLRLVNYSLAADYSFLLSINTADRQKVDRLFKKLNLKKDDRLIGLSPSSVVNKKCLKLGLDYPTVTAELVGVLAGEGYTVAIIPHSIRRDGKAHNNDLPLAQDIFGLLEETNNVRLIKELDSPTELREAIGRCDIFIASRFHAMVSSLAMGVPPVVIGWSHKYQEVIDMFGIKTPTLNYSELNLPRLEAAVKTALETRAQTHRSIMKSLPKVMDSSRQNTRAIERALRGD